MHYDFLRTALQKRNLKMVDVVRALGVQKAQVTNWNKVGVPPGRLIAIEDALGIPGHELRPDIIRPPISADRAA